MRERHGMRNTPEYRVWVDMRLRCYHPERSDYKHYGGRGIKVCDRWRDSFVSFYADMGGRPTKNHTIDRVNNDGDYTPENCKWSTKEEQSRNQRMYVTNTSGVTGVSWSKQNKRWIANIYFKERLVHLGSFADKVAAIRARQKGERLYR